MNKRELENIKDVSQSYLFGEKILNETLEASSGLIGLPKNWTTAINRLVRKCLQNQVFGGACLWGMTGSKRTKALGLFLLVQHGIHNQIFL